MKKLGVIVHRETPYRQSEATRVALGMTLCNDSVELIVIDDEMKFTEAIKKNITLLGSMHGKAYSNNPKNGLEKLSLEEIAKKLAEYDVVIPY